MSEDLETYVAKCKRALAEMGGTHSLEDILAAIESGQMQSFAEGNTWAVTQIFDTPQKRVLEIVLVIGDLPEARRLHDIVEAWGRQHGCTLVRTFAREGWLPDARARGWTVGHRIFLKDIQHGHGRSVADDEREQGSSASAVG